MAHNKYRIESNIVEWDVIYATDYLGRILQDEDFLMTHESLDVSGLSSGVYLFVMKNNRGMYDSIKIQVTK